MDAHCEWLERKTNISCKSTKSLMLPQKCLEEEEGYILSNQQQHFLEET